MEEDIDKSNHMSFLSQETKLSKDLQTRFYILSWSAPSNFGQNLVAMGSQRSARWTPEKLHVKLGKWKTKFGESAAPAKKIFCKKLPTTGAVFRPAIKSALITPFVR